MTNRASAKAVKTTKDTKGTKVAEVGYDDVHGSIVALLESARRAAAPPRAASMR